MHRWLVAILACGCGASALIPPGDATFERAEVRLERTTREVEASGAPPAEQALFLQAEALYRYRFRASGHGGAGVVAETAAAAADLPVLQSLAASLDLLDLRVRAADAAVQLWETFLARHPRSVLRPLALYRLGWAYRNASAVGLPRDSDRAFADLLRAGPPRELAALVPAARAVRWKSKRTAATLSLVPGAGQLYVGETGNGLVRLAVALAAAAAVVVPTIIAFKHGSDLSWSHDWPLLAIGAGGAMVLSIDYSESYDDAMRGVVDWNERAEAAFDDAHPDAP